ncbi:phosphoenolpyruvate--protein phosphotransferase [Sedimentibacter sp. zth1]|uniref:phosphoenolpyruvate--protein phosphotransferase n=1 Tax=Sedimentibacter sp. zth1 TaxID=2816908 RepID=UPI001A923CEE|nr:phosphoenolpyruvate--protein phosphotransferase [Sedimentibacter sp. zth1]QSX05581.1 phosphoenolpyruvate--protein phosphotransferase [Sedimentibacter sp. zth1]
MKGIGVSQGIGIGRVFKAEKNDVNIEKRNVENTLEEVKKLEDALVECKNQLDEIYEITLKNVGKKEAEIFMAHQMILDDDAVFNEVTLKIEKEKVNAEFALVEILGKYIKLFENIEDEYLKERALDLKDLMYRIARIILGIKTKKISNIEKNTVLVAEDLTPSDTSQIDKEKVNAIIVEVGGRTSHAAIIARTMEIPTIVGVEKICSSVEDGDEIICDGSTGEISINPTQKVKSFYEEKSVKEEEQRKKLKNLIGLKSETKDNYKVNIVANIGILNDVKYALQNDAEGIGLFRSEFLYMERNKVPSEEEQFQAYKEIIVKMQGKPVVIRTLDVGGDKDLPYLNIPKEMNPFLGYRAIRLCLDNTDIFKTQLRAILRASAYGNVKILFPMISSLNELRGAKRLYEETKQELISENIEVNHNIKLGIMIEIPSAAIIADVLAKEVDFFSIGTNDLIQYTLAVDRTNPKINHLYNQYHPALLRLIYNVIKSAHKANIEVAMCGEMAGEPTLIPVLIGMGLNEFSMSPSSILQSRDIIRSFSKSECEQVAKKVLEFDLGIDVEKYLVGLLDKE